MIKQTIGNFFVHGGRASNRELARLYGVPANVVRASISALRKQGMPISKVLYTNRVNEAYYQLVPEMVIPRRGRPAHKYAVDAT